MTVSVEGITLLTGDCLIESDAIESGTVDLILTDPPYGTIKGLWGEKTKWDDAISPTDIFDIANRILRRNGKMVLFSQEPYTTRLITEAHPNIPFSQRAIWEKDNFANHLGAKKALVSYYEDIIVFSKTHDTDALHPLRHYFAKVRDYVGLTKKAIIDAIGQRADHSFRTDSTQFSLCTEATYDALIDRYRIDRMPGFMPYEELREIDRKYDSVFNLWQGGKYKSNILRYKKDYDGFHPTQKPVALLEDLIKTYTNEGNTVCDLTMGSGTTAVAAVNTGRNYVLIEREPEYCEIARKRVADALQAK